MEYNAINILHHQAIRSLQSRFPSYSSAVRLLLQWTAEHCYSDHISAVFFELLCASVYLHPDSNRPPSSPSSAFILSLKRYVLGL